MNRAPKVALVHDWLNGMRGGEKVLEVFCDLFPDADIFTLIHQPGTLSEKIARHRITSSFLMKMPLAQKKYRHYLPLMPAAIRSLDLSGYDFVVSTSHCVAKGCDPKGAPHLSCCFTPMRYIWDQYHHYFDGASLPVRAAMSLIRPWLQRWDVDSSRTVTRFIAISEFVKGRIQNYYGRDSDVIYPPADTDFYVPGTANEVDPFYLIVSALVPYKRLDLAVEAFNRSGLKLKIIGKGPEEARLKSIAKANVEFLGWRSDEELKRHYQTCRALVFPGTEDFGIVPIEAMACGRPVVAYADGALRETVAENVTGVFFESADVESILEAVSRADARRWDPSAIRNHALRFSRGRYVEQIRDYLLKNFSLPFDFPRDIS